MHAAYRPRELNTWVDDLAHQERGRRQTVVTKVVQVAGALVAGLKGLGFKVAAKCTILAHPPQVGQEIVTALEKKGIILQTARSGKDLGVDAHVGRRSTKALKGRMTKAGKRARAIAQLVRVDRATKVLAKTGFKPQAVWGLEAQGLAPSTLKRLRAQVAGMSGCKHPGGCSTTAIRLAYDETADPHHYGRTQLLREWLHLYTELQDQRGALALTWRRITAQLRSSPRPWNKVKGPVSAVVATLLDLEWDPVGPGLWRDLDGAEYNLEKDDPDELIDYAIAGAVNQQVWCAASRWHHGGGAQGGGPHHGRPTSSPTPPRWRPRARSHPPDGSYRQSLAREPQIRHRGPAPVASAAGSRP